jgi:hypothetical protein
MQRRLNDYIHLPEIDEDIEKYIVLPQLGDKSGILGAIALAKQECFPRFIPACRILDINK